MWKKIFLDTAQAGVRRIQLRGDFKRFLAAVLEPLHSCKRVIDLKQLAKLTGCTISNDPLEGGDQIVLYTKFRSLDVFIHLIVREGARKQSLIDELLYVEQWLLTNGYYETFCCGVRIMSGGIDTSNLSVKEFSRLQMYH